MVSLCRVNSLVSSKSVSIFFFFLSTYFEKSNMNLISMRSLSFKTEIQKFWEQTDIHSGTEVVSSTNQAANTAQKEHCIEIWTGETLGGFNICDLHLIKMRLLTEVILLSVISQWWNHYDLQWYQVLSLDSHRKELPTTEYLAKPVLKATIPGAHFLSPKYASTSHLSRDNRNQGSAIPPNRDPILFPDQHLLRQKGVSIWAGCVMRLWLFLWWRRQQSMGKAPPESSTSSCVIFKRLCYKILQ